MVFFVSDFITSDAVFFGTYCGFNVHRGAKRKGLGDEETIVYKNEDVRCSSLKEAVKFSKQNNLLGVICGAQTLVKLFIQHVYLCHIAQFLFI